MKKDYLIVSTYLVSVLIFRWNLPRFIGFPSEAARSGRGAGCAASMASVCTSCDITRARRPTGSGRKVTERRELLSNSAGGPFVYQAAAVVSLTLYEWLRLSEHAFLFRPTWQRQFNAMVFCICLIFCEHACETIHPQHPNWQSNQFMFYGHHF